MGNSGLRDNKETKTKQSWINKKKILLAFLYAMSASLFSHVIVTFSYALTMYKTSHNINLEIVILICIIF